MRVFYSSQGCFFSLYGECISCALDKLFILPIVDFPHFRWTFVNGVFLLLLLCWFSLHVLAISNVLVEQFILLCLDDFKVIFERRLNENSNFLHTLIELY